VKKPVINPEPKEKLPAEDKIKEAARKLFTQKGYAATKTRDIAAEAGINLASLNYYFRSKQKLFDIIMMESMEQFLKGISAIFQDTNIGFEDKIEMLVGSYIDMLNQNPDLPLFILTEIRNNPQKLFARIDAKVQFQRSSFIMQLMKKLSETEKPPIHPLHFIANMMGLIVFPFVAFPLLKKVSNLDDEQYKLLMNDRKTLIPDWLKSMKMHD
jgi:AcrR family transcriptional regulator